jgi:hypothetical protein
VNAEQEKLIATTVHDASGCWLWSRGLDRHGYGKAYFRGKQTLAHRASYIAFHGEVPIGTCVLHRCDVRRCINPGHLFVGSIADNNRDAWGKGRTRGFITSSGKSRLRGSAHHRALVTEQKVREIRQARQQERASIKQLASRYGLKERTIKSIVQRENWRHI